MIKRSIRLDVNKCVRSQNVTKQAMTYLAWSTCQACPFLKSLTWHGQPAKQVRLSYLPMVIFYNYSIDVNYYFL